MLVPEISLTPQTIRRFQRRFPQVAVLHSHLSDAERHRHWQTIAAGEVSVVVGVSSSNSIWTSNPSRWMCNYKRQPRRKVRTGQVRSRRVRSRRARTGHHGGGNSDYRRAAGHSLPNHPRKSKPPSRKLNRFRSISIFPTPLLLRRRRRNQNHRLPKSVPPHGWKNLRSPLLPFPILLNRVLLNRRWICIWMLMSNPSRRWKHTKRRSSNNQNLRHPNFDLTPPDLSADEGLQNVSPDASESNSLQPIVGARISLEFSAPADAVSEVTAHIIPVDPSPLETAPPDIAAEAPVEKPRKRTTRSRKTPTAQPKDAKTTRTGQAGSAQGPRNAGGG